MKTQSQQTFYSEQKPKFNNENANIVRVKDINLMPQNIISQPKKGSMYIESSLDKKYSKNNKSTLSTNCSDYNIFDPTNFERRNSGARKDVNNNLRQNFLQQENSLSRDKNNTYRSFNDSIDENSLKAPYVFGFQNKSILQQGSPISKNNFVTKEVRL